MMIEAAMQENQCPHNVFLDDKCSSCKLRKSDCPNITTVPFNYLRCGDNMSLSLSAIDQFRVQDLRVILGQRKLNLILDLDNTLIHSKKRRKFTLEDKKNVTNDSNDLYKVEGSSRLVKLRPGAREFLKKVRDMFELSIYTLGKRDYAQRIASLLAGKSNLDIRSMFGKIITKEDCTKAKEKGLDVVLSDRRVVLIVDDKEDIWEKSCRANVIKIAPYCFFEDKKIQREIDDKLTMDDGLKRVLSTLTLVHQLFYDEDNNGDGGYMQRDVRHVLERVRDREEEKKRESEEVSKRKRLEETKARIFIEKFCAPVGKKCKREAGMGVGSPWLV